MIRGSKMVTRTRGWIDVNKGFVVTVLILIISGVVAFADVKSLAKQNRVDIDGVCQEYRAYVKETAMVDFTQSSTIMIIKTEIEHIKKTIDETKHIQSKMDEKLDTLLMRSN